MSSSEDLYEVLMTKMMIKAGGNIFQIFDNGNLTRETSHTSSTNRCSRLKFLYDHKHPTKNIKVSDKV